MRKRNFYRILLCVIIPLSLFCVSFGSVDEESPVFSNNDVPLTYTKSGPSAINDEKTTRLYVETDGLLVRAIQESDENYGVSAHYPKTESEAVNNLINAFIEGTIDDFKSSCTKGTIEIRYQPYRYKDCAVSFLFEITMTKDGNDSARKLSKIYDLMGGIELSRNDIFDENTDYMTELTEKLRLAVQNEAFGDTLLNVSVDDFLFDDHNMYFIQNVSGMCEILSEMPIIKLPMADLSEFITIDGYFGEYFKKDGDNAPEKEFGDNLIAIVNEEQLDELSTPFIVPSDQEPLTAEDRKLIAITFDDGPHHAYTPRLLDILDKHDAKATFFLLGHRIPYTPELVERMINEGHSVGNHSYNHKQLTAISNKELIYQLDTTNELITDITDVDVTLLRPPYGSSNKAVIKESVDRGMALIMWNIDPEDWKSKSGAEIAKHVVDRAKEGDIILLHDVYERSVDAAEIIIEKLTADGFTFVTVETLLEENVGFTAGASYRSALKKVMDYEPK